MWDKDLKHMRETYAEGVWELLGGFLCGAFTFVVVTALIALWTV